MAIEQSHTPNHHVSIHAHPHPETTLIPHLQSHLPHSIPLLRRIQHDLIHPSSTAVVLSTLDPTDTNPTPTQNEEEEPWLAAHADLFRGRETQVVIYSSLERTEPQSTRIPYPTSSEIPTTFLAELTCSDEKKALLREQLTGVLKYVKTVLLPVYLEKYPRGVYGSSSQSPPPGDGKIPPPPPKAFLVGSLCTGVLGVLRGDTLGFHTTGFLKDENEMGVEGVRVHRIDSGYGKFVFEREMYSPSASSHGENGNGIADEVKIHRLYSGHGKYIFDREMYSQASPSSSIETGNGSSTNDPNPAALPTPPTTTTTEQSHPLPPNYKYQTIPPTFKFDLIRSRTAIFRSNETLAKMGGVAIYHCPYHHHHPSQDQAETSTARDNDDDKPIGWAFISVDGSLSTLHIEPEHRGKGLAVQLGKETMRRAMSVGDIGNSGVFHDSVCREKNGFMHADVKLENAASRRVMEKIGGVVRWTDAWVVLEVVQ